MELSERILDGYDPSDRERIAKIEQEYPQAIFTVSLLASVAGGPELVSISIGDQTAYLDPVDARTLAESILEIADGKEIEQWDSCRGVLFTGRLTQATIRRKRPTS